MENINWSTKQVEEVIKQGNGKIATFNNHFDKVNIQLINILKYDERARVDYGYLYLKFIEIAYNVKVSNIPDKLISPESIGRLKRKLIENSQFNDDLKFLRNLDNESLNNESKEYYRNN